MSFKPYDTFPSLGEVFGGDYEKMMNVILESRESGQNWTPEEFHDEMMEDALQLCEPKDFGLYKDDGIHWSVLYTKEAFVEGWHRVAHWIDLDKNHDYVKYPRMREVSDSEE